MLASLRTEKRASDLGTGHRIFLLFLVSMGSSIIYTPAYLKFVFYDPLMKALEVSNAQLGALLSAYALTATICYLPSGIVADKIRVRTLGWVGFTTTALLTYAYAMLPSFNTLMWIFVAMGVTTILIWWGIRFKLVRLISEESEYSRNIGISYGIYGLAGLILGLVNSWIVATLADKLDLAVTTLLIFVGTVILILGILSFLFIPKFEGEITSGKSAFSVTELLQVFRTPVIWISAGCMFFVYFYYTGVTYTTPYLQNVLGASLGVVSFIGVIRTYGITLLSGPAFGFLAKAAKSPSKIIAGGSIVAALGLLAFLILPAGKGSTVIAVVIIIALGFIANGVFGIVSSQLTEGKVPLTIFGTATGILSVIGFLPDTFSSTWFGALIDEKENAAYPEIFTILAISAFLAALFALLLVVYVRRNAARLEAIEEATAAHAAGKDA